MTLLLVLLFGFLFLIAFFSSALLFSSSFVASLSTRVDTIIDCNFLEVVMSQEQREISLAIAANAKDILIFFLRQWWVFRIHILHDIGYFFRVQAPNMLEPYDTAFHSTEVAMRPQLFSKLLQDFMLIFFLGPSQLG